MDINAGAEKTNIEVKHLVAAVGPKNNRESVPKDLAHLQDLLTKDKGKSIFEAKVAKDDADVFVNFTEMRQMVDGERDPKKPVDSQSEYWKELNQKLTIYDKLLNGKVDKLGLDKNNNPDPAEKQVVLKVLGEIPGFAESIAISTGGKMSIEQARDFLLKGKGTIPPEARKTVAEMIGGFIGDDELRLRLEKKLSELSNLVPENSLSNEHEINGLIDQVRGKEALILRKKALEDSQEKFKDLTTEQRQQAEDLFVRVSDLKKEIKKEYQPAVLTEAGIQSSILQVQGQLDGLAATIKTLDTARLHPEEVPILDRYGVDTGRTRKTFVKDTEVSTVYIERLNDQRDLNRVLTQLESLKAVYADQTQKDLLQSYSSFNNAKAKLAEEVNPELIKVSDAERLLVDKIAQRNKYADKYKSKLDKTLSEEMKRYWNEVKMEDASQAAVAEANEKKKIEDTAKAKAEALLDKYLHLSFMKYKNGKVVGMDDKAIKEFMHKDMLSQSPAQLARTFIERIDDKSGVMPPEYQEEIAKLFKDMGVGAGDPPMTFDKVMEKIGQKNFEEFAARKVPDMLGFAWSKGYYFDRMKLKKHEAQFLQEAYKDPEFFKTAMKDRDDQIKLAQELLKDKVLSGVISPDTIKDLIGKDWTEGGAKLMKLLAVGAGAYVLGGGLAFGFDKAGLALGAQHAVDNLKGVGFVAGQGVQAVSRAGNMALHGIVGDWRTGVEGIAPIVDPNNPNAVLVPGTAADPSKMGGVMGQLSKLMQDGSGNPAPLGISRQGIPTP